MNTPLHFRQGDVLIVRCAGLPAGCKPVDREEGRVVLAHGEVTGHAHAIVEPDVVLYEQDGNYYIRVPRQAVVQHEEHAPIPLGAGNYRVVRQQEYDPNTPRVVPHETPMLPDIWERPTRRPWGRFVLD